MKRHIMIQMMLAISAVVLSVVVSWAGDGVKAEERLPPIPHDGAQQCGQVEEPTGTVTLEEAIAFALGNHPELASSALETHAKDAESAQAGLALNPEIGLEMENVGGTGDFHGLDSTETSLKVGQTFELGGKRHKRKRVAELERDLSVWEYEAERLNVVHNVKRRFVELLTAQENLMPARRRVELALKAHEVVSERVKAGQVSPLDEKKSQIMLSKSRIEFTMAEREVDAARKNLAAAWGSNDARFSGVVGKLRSIEEPPALEVLAEKMKNHPELSQYSTMLDRGEANLTLERARSVPDLSVGGGVKYENEIDDYTYIVEFSVPLPLFDRNQGAVRAAEIRKKQVKADYAAALVEMRLALETAYQTLLVSYDEAESLKEEVLPNTEDVFKSAQEGYEYGQFGYLDVLDAQETLFRAQEDYLRAISNYNLALVDIEYITASLLSEGVSEAQQGQEEKQHE